MSVVCRNCLAFTFAPLLQKEVDEFVLYWNTHKIRANRLANCPSGIPDDLYDMPAHVGTLLHAPFLTTACLLCYTGAADHLKSIQPAVWVKAMSEFSDAPPPFYTPQFEKAANDLLKEDFSKR